jgi:hypothetical protein
VATTGTNNKINSKVFLFMVEPAQVFKRLAAGHEWAKTLNPCKTNYLEKSVSKNKKNGAGEEREGIGSLLRAEKGVSLEERAQWYKFNHEVQYAVCMG